MECISPRDLAKRAGVRPQMIYNYLLAERIPSHACAEGHTTICINLKEAEDWLDIREAKARVKYEAIQRQLRGEV